MSERMRVREIAARVQGGASAVEIARETLARVDAYDAIQPQTWIKRLAAADILSAAAAIDARVKAGEQLALAGVPFAVKDNIDVAGLPTTAACPAFAYTPNESAPVVQRLIDAGALLIGKTNLDQFATGLVGVRSPHGAPGCVFNRAYVSGGSSSGSAVATAAGVVAFALGTDTAGSGRVPAAFNALIGVKPSKGRWSTRGVVPACRSLDCVSMFASSHEDAALIDSVLTWFDAADPYARPAPNAPAAPITRLGVPRSAHLNWFGDAEAQSFFDAAVTRAASLGVDLVEVDIAPLIDCARLLYQGPWVAERTAAMADILRRAPNAIDPTVRAIVQAGGAMSAIDAFEGFYALKRFEREAQKLWREIDALLLPTTPTIYRIAEIRAEPFALNANLGLYTNFVNLLDMAAVATPAGFRANGTGFGVSFIGPAWSDGALLDLAARFDPREATPPLDLEAPAPRIKLAVVGAHLAGMPLHWQLTSRNARFVGAAKTASEYKLYAMTHTAPPKPALIHVGDGGGALEVEVYELDEAAFGSFTAEVPAPLAIGTVTLADGSSVKGFVAEPRAMQGAEDITALGGWRAFIASRAKN